MAALETSVAWLQAQQAADGGWVGFSGASDVGVTIDGVLALIAASNRGIEVDLTAATGFLRANGEPYAESGAGAAAKLTLAAVALGIDPTDFEGIDMIEEMEEGFARATDFYGEGVYDHALVIMAMAAAGEEVPDDAISRLNECQLEDGSWSFDGTNAECSETDALVGNGDTNTTAVVMQALVAAGATGGDQIMHALEFLAESALPNGFAFQRGPGAVADANSTALVVQALMAAGEDPESQEWQNVAGSLLAFQNESGSFSYQLDPRDENLYATVQVIPAIAAQPLPITASSESTLVALPTCTSVQVATPESLDRPCAA